MCQESGISKRLDTEKNSWYVKEQAGVVLQWEKTHLFP